jgi:hypothetical protein
MALMKKLKIFGGLVTALAICASSAQAVTVVGTTKNYSKVSVALTLTANGITSVKNGVSKQTTDKLKIASKDLVALFAVWTTNNLAAWQAAGAQLIFDWTTNKLQLCVADKSGTNILFYAGNGVNNGTNGVMAFFSIHWYNRVGPFAETTVEKNPGSDKVSRNFTAFFEFSYADGILVDQFDLYAFSPNTETWSQAWDKDGIDTKWSDTELFLPNYSGLAFKGLNDSQVSGSITAKGSGSGSNPAGD